jgi:hypothetical protein
VRLTTCLRSAAGACPRAAHWTGRAAAMGAADGCASLQLARGSASDAPRGAWLCCGSPAPTGARGGGDDRGSLGACPRKLAPAARRDGGFTARARWGWWLDTAGAAPNPAGAEGAFSVCCRGMCSHGSSRPAASCAASSVKRLLACEAAAAVVRSQRWGLLLRATPPREANARRNDCLGIMPNCSVASSAGKSQPIAPPSSPSLYTLSSTPPLQPSAS